MKRPLFTLLVTIVVGAVAAFAAAPSANAAWPQEGRPVSLINPFPAGGSIDISSDKSLKPIIDDIGKDQQKAK